MKDTIVMIHGMWGSSRVWGRYKAYFEAAGYSCLTPVLRFHDVDPASDPDPALGCISLVDYVQDVEKEISNLGVRPILMGHSMGGLIAQLLATKNVAKALVLLAPAPPAGLEIFNISSARTLLRNRHKINATS